MLKKIIPFLIFVLLVSCGKNIEDTKKSVKTDSGSPISNGSGDNNDNVDQNSITNIQKDKLMEALNSNDVSIVETRLRINSFVDFQFDNGETPLTLSLKKSRVSIVNKILDKSKNMDLVNSKLQSPLILAIYNSSIETVKKIHLFGANINLGARNGDLPVEIALNSDKNEMALYFLKEGSKLPMQRFVSRVNLDENFKPFIKLLNNIKEHELPAEKYLHRTISKGNYHFLEYLLINFTLYQETLVKRNFLIPAIKIEDPIKRNNIVKLLLGYGADPDNTEGVPPLILAVENEDYPTVASLLIAKTNPVVLDDLGKSPLDYAVQSLNKPILNLLNSVLRRVRSEENKESIDMMYFNACSILDFRSRARLSRSQRTVIKNLQVTLNCD